MNAIDRTNPLNTVTPDWRVSEARELVTRLRQERSWQDWVVVAILNGGLTTARIVATELELELVGFDPKTRGSPPNLKDRKVLLVDEGCRTGRTINQVIEVLNSTSGPERIVFACHTIPTRVAEALPAETISVQSDPDSPAASHYGWGS